MEWFRDGDSCLDDEICAPTTTLHSEHAITHDSLRGLFTRTRSPHAASPGRQITLLTAYACRVSLVYLVRSDALFVHCLVSRASRQFSHSSSS